MIRVLGVDPSTAATGLAYPYEDRFHTIVPDSGPENVPGRLFEIECAFEGILHTLTAREMVDFAVVEGVSLRGKGGPLTLLRLAQLSGIIQKSLYRFAIPFVEVNSSSLKKYATGNGAAQKHEMVKAAKERGAHPGNDNEADAFWLKQIGDHYWNMEPTEASFMLEKHQLDLHERLPWPVLS